MIVHTAETRENNFIFSRKPRTGRTRCSGNNFIFATVTKSVDFIAVWQVARKGLYFLCTNVAAVTLARIALALRVDLYYLLGLSDEPEPWKNKVRVDRAQNDLGR